IAFPEEILGDIDEKKHDNILTREQVAKIIYYQEEMSGLLGADVFNKFKEDGVFQSSNAELVKSIAIDMSKNPSHWNGLSYLNSTDVSYWDSLLYRIINLQPGNWETRSSTFVAFIKTLKDNWSKTIPEL